jgi:hypothetical protein
MPLSGVSQRQWSRRAWRDSNPQPTDSKSGALSVELQALVPSNTVYHRYIGKPNRRRLTKALDPRPEVVYSAPRSLAVTKRGDLPSRWVSR